MPLDRTKYIEEIFDELRKLAVNDIRIGQAFEILRKENNDGLFNIENDKFLELIKKFTKDLKWVT